MSLSHVSIFDREKSTTLFPNASSLVTAKAMILKRHDHITRTVVKTHWKFHRIFYEASLTNTEIIWGTLKTMTLYFGLSRMWLSKCTRAYKSIIQLTVLTIFLYKFIWEASKCHLCKFYRIASNSLQAIQIVNELFDCPLYFSLIFTFSHKTNI